MLHISNLSVTVQEQDILKEVTLSIEPGSTHVLMGPNGSGKSTLALALMGHPNYAVQNGSAKLHNNDLLHIPVHKRAQKGLFLSFQQPLEISGVPIASFLKAAYESVHGHITPAELKEKVLHHFDLLNMDHALFYRNLHEGFSGGQKKKLEMVQLLLLKPKIAILDEIDSGLDVDALQDVAKALKYAQKEDTQCSLLIITHYQRILRYIKPDHVHIMQKGAITHTGDDKLVAQIEQFGYDELQNAHF